MDTDLSLIEISGEDDSLLSPQSLNDGVSISICSNTTSYFSCSPLLQIPASTAFSEEGTRSKPSCSNCEDSKDKSNVDKENVNLNKQEPPKLSIEPQQMKRKKKGGGGFNLRKSLAWNRAFFTEEGVLDPLELSMLGGNLGKSNGEMLSVIHEGRESLSGDLEILDDNLSKGVPSSSPNRSRKLSASSPKVGSPVRHKNGPASASKRKVFAAQDINRSASKRNGCPRPVASSSVKRPLSTNTTKVVTKDSRVSKTLTSKVKPSAVSTSSRGSITSAGRPSRNVVSQPGNAKRNFELNENSTNIKTVQNYARTSLSGKLITKSTTQPARRNVVKISSVPEINSSSNAQGQSKVNIEMVPDTVVPATLVAYGPESNTRNIAVSSSQNICYNDGNRQLTQHQTAKPSGLRMPSPSLGFFGQPKLSDSRSSLQRSSQACNHSKSKIPNFNKGGVLNPIQQRPPRPSGNLPMYSSTVNSVESSSAASSGRIKSTVESNPGKTAGLQLQYDPKNCDTAKHQQQQNNGCDVDQSSLDHVETCKIEKISSREKLGLQSSHNKFSLQNGPWEQLESGLDRSAVDVFPRSRNSIGSENISVPVEAECLSEMKNIDVRQHVEDGQFRPSTKILPVCSDSRIAEVDNLRYDTALEGHEDQLNGMHGTVRQSSEQAEVIKSDTYIINQISNVKRQILDGTLFEERRSPEELGKYGNSNTVDVPLEVRESGVTSYFASHCPDIEPTKDTTRGNDCLDKELLAGDVKVLSVDGNLLGESGKSSLIISALVNSNLMIIDNASTKSAEEAEFPGPSSVTEQAQVLSVDGNLLGANGKSSLITSALVNSNLMIIDNASTKSAEEAEFPGPSSVTEQAQVLSVDGNPLGESGKSSLITSMLVNSNLMIIDNASTKSDGEAEFPGPSSVTEQVFQDNCGPLSVGCLVHGKCSVDYQDKHVFENLKSSELRTNDCGGGLDETGNSEYLHVENAPIVYADSEQAAQKFNHDVMLSVDANRLELERMDEQTAEKDKEINSCLTEAEQANQGQDGCDDPLHYKSKSLKDVGAIDAGRSDTLRSLKQCEIMENELAGVDNWKETSIENALEQSLDDNSLVEKNKEAFSLSPPINAVPSSDEWLATCCENDYLSTELHAGDAQVLSVDGGKNSLNTSALVNSNLMIIDNARMKSAEEAEFPRPGNVAEQARVLSVDGNPLGESGKSSLITSVLVNSNLMIMDNASTKSAGEAEFPGPGSVTEQVFQDNCGPLSDGCFVHGKGSVDSQNKDVLENLKSSELKTDACGGGLTSSNILSSPSAVTQDCGSDETGNSEYIHVENALIVYADSEQAAQKSNVDVKLSVEANRLELEGMDKSNMIGAVITDNVDLNNLYTERGELSGSKLENLCVTAQISHRMQIEVGSDMTNKIESQGAILSEKNLIPFSDNELQPAKDASCSESGIDILRSDWSISILDVKEQAAEEDKEINSCFSKAEQVNQGQEGCDDLLHDKSKSLKDVGAIDASRWGTLYSPNQREIMENELAGVDNLKETLIENARQQSLDDKSLVEKNKDALSLSSPLNAVPFSDEWLAAIEAAGEEILARKGGAVQNSPPDKSLPEPGPWSPVKRKNNQGIGPYDCTKFTNISNPSSTSN